MSLSVETNSTRCLRF